MRYFGFDKSVGGFRRFDFGGVGDTSSGGGTPILGAIPTDYVLRYDFNGDLLDKSPNALDGVKSGSANFDVGRKTGTQSMSFVEGVVKTKAPLSLGSDKVTLSFWVKPNNTTDPAMLFELGEGFASLGTFAAYMNLYSPQTATMCGYASYNHNRATTTALSQAGVWSYVTMTYDRSLSGANEINVFLNGELAIGARNNVADTAGVISTRTLYIGATYDTKNPFNGNFQDIRVYNRILTAEEINQLYRE